MARIELLNAKWHLAVVHEYILMNRTIQIWSIYSTSNLTSLLSQSMKLTLANIETPFSPLKIKRGTHRSHKISLLQNVHIPAHTGKITNTKGRCTYCVLPPLARNGLTTSAKRLVASIAREWFHELLAQLECRIVMLLGYPSILILVILFHNVFSTILYPSDGLTTKRFMPTVSILGGGFINSQHSWNTEWWCFHGIP